MASLLSTLKSASRHWTRKPGLAAAVVVAMASGIGSALGMFEVTNALLIRPLPWPSSERLVSIYATLPRERSNPARSKTWNSAPITWAAWDHLRESAAFDGVAAYVERQLLLDNVDPRVQSEVVQVMHVSASYLSLLGGGTVRGRFFTADEDTDVTSEAAVISYPMWQRQFGGRVDVAGQVLYLKPNADFRPRGRTVVGVLAHDFAFPEGEPVVLLPLGPMSVNGRYDADGFLRGIARLADNVEVDQAASLVAPIIRGGESPDRKGARLVSLRNQLSGKSGPSVLLMSVCAGMLFLISCAAAVGLLLSDGMARQRDIAVYTALGASRGQIIARLLVEQIGLVLIAVVFGFAISVWLSHSMTALIGIRNGRSEATIDWLSVEFGTAMALICVATASAVVIGTAVAASKKRNLSDVGQRATRFRGTSEKLVAGIASGLAMVLVTTSVVLGQTVLRLQERPLGFDASGLIVLRVVPAAFPAAQAAPANAFAPAQSSIEDARQAEARRFDRGWQHIAGLLGALKGVVGVISAAGVGTTPFGGAWVQDLVRSDGATLGEEQLAQAQVVTDSYFKTMRVPLLAGRALVASDRGMHRAVVSSEFNRQFLRNEGVGARFMRGEVAYDVVGVVGDAKHAGFDDGDLATYYLLDTVIAHINQIIVRVDGQPTSRLGDIREAVRNYDPHLLVTSVTTMDHLVSSSIQLESSRAALMGIFGVASLALVAMGLFALLTRHVLGRQREIGLRLALGAQGRDVYALILREALASVSLGLVGGLLGSIAAAKFISSLLVDTAPLSAEVIVFPAVLLIAVAGAATVVPAYRAGRLDLIRVLK